MVLKILLVKKLYQYLFIIIEIKKHIWVHNTHLQASHDFFQKIKV